MDDEYQSQRNPFDESVDQIEPLSMDIQPVLPSQSYQLIPIGPPIPPAPVPIPPAPVSVPPAAAEIIDLTGPPDREIIDISDSPPGSGDEVVGEASPAPSESPEETKETLETKKIRQFLEKVKDIYPDQHPLTFFLGADPSTFTTHKMTRKELGDMKASLQPDAQDAPYERTRRHYRSPNILPLRKEYLKSMRESSPPSRIACPLSPERRYKTVVGIRRHWDRFHRTHPRREGRSYDSAEEGPPPSKRRRRYGPSGSGWLRGHNGHVPS